MPGLLVHARSFLHLSVDTAFRVGVRYFLFAGLAWLLGYVLFRRHWQHRKINQRHPAYSDMWREIRYSVLSLLIFGAMSAATVFASYRGWNQLYWRIDQFGWTWFCLSILCAVLLHDAYFYWTHRMMHHRRLFRAFHRTHHLSHNPSPWTAYAFAPLEAIVEAGIFPLTAILIPIHPIAFFIFMGVQIVFNVLIHTGYEFNPPWMMDSWLGRVLNTPTNHVLHHETSRGNFGLYFNLWDRLMRTNHLKYEARFREVTARRAEARGPVSA